MKTIIRMTAIAAVVIAIAGCGNDKKVKYKLPVSDDAANTPNFVMEGFRLSSTEEGKKKWEVEARAAQVFELKKKAYAQAVTVRYYEGRPGAVSVITGDRAVISTDNNSMEISGNVAVRASNGTVLKTEQLFWDDAKKRMFTEAEVTIIKDRSVLRGIGLESDAEMVNMRIKKQVHLKAEDIGDER